jgi:hypothetical protein
LFGSSSRSRFPSRHCSLKVSRGRVDERRETLRARERRDVIVARLALGLEDDWPVQYVRAAIESCNALGEQPIDAG